MNRIEHPTRNSDLKSLRHPDYDDLLSNPPQGTHHFNLSSTKRMVPVMDLLWTELMSSVRRRCAVCTQRCHPSQGRP